MSILNDSPQNFRGPCIFKVCVGGVWAVGGVPRFTFYLQKAASCSRFKMEGFPFNFPFTSVNYKLDLPLLEAVKILSLL